MNNFIKSDPKEEAKYESYLELIFNNDFYDNKENLDKIAKEIIELKDYKGLCFLLHIFYDTVLVEEYIKKGLNTKHLFNTYIYLMNLLDKELELPHEYYKNELMYKDDKNIYFNYYVDLRTLIDHSIIPYEDGQFISRDVDSWATSLKFDDVSNKPGFFDETSKEEFINGALGAFNNKHQKDYTDAVYQLLDEYKSLKENDINRYQYLNKMRQCLLDFNDEEFLTLGQKVIDHDDMKTIIFSILDFADLASKYPTTFSKMRCFYHFTRVFNDLRNKTKIRFENFNPYELTIDINNFDHFVACYNIICSALIGYLDACYEMNVDAISDNYSNIKTLFKYNLKVNKFYTDLLGKSFDNFFYSFLQLYYNPGEDIIDFGVFYTTQETNPLDLIWMELVFFNNVTSQDYADQINPFLENAMKQIYDGEVNFRVIMKDSLIAAGNLQKTAYDDFADIYNELYGERENPMSSANFIS